MLPDPLDVVIGVDTHADTHALALVDAASAALLAQTVVAASREGYRQALAFARGRPGGRAFALEGSGCYGAGLARFLEGEGERVFEVERAPRPGRRGRAKSDALDAERAARALLAGEPLACPRRGARREALRVLLLTREAAVDVRRAGLNQLRALVITAPEQLRERLHGLPAERLLARCLALRAPAQADAAVRATVHCLRACAARVRAAGREAQALARQLTALVRELAPALLAEPGVGPITAAQLLLAWSHRGRLRSEAAFARLAGAAPIPASSGKTLRHRLDRGGDRRLNRALHTIALTRRRCDQRTHAYLQRRIREGKSEREALRSLKRYLARSLFRLLERTAPTTA